MNEPYQRVSQDNSVFDGALIGAAIGAGGAGAGVFGTRMHYNGIENRVKRDVQALEGQQEFFQKYANNSERRLAREVGRADRTNLFNRRAMADPERRQAIIDNRIDRAERRYDKATEKINAHENTLRQMRDPNYLSERQSNHLYGRRMGGWKNAAIIGASSVIGGGLGMITDELVN